MSTQLNRIAKVAKEKRNEKFTSLAHLLNTEFLAETWLTLNLKGVAGVDNVTIKEYGDKLSANLENLVERLKSGKYRATPSLRMHIPKEKNKTRPLSIPIVEDRLVQKAVARILSVIYEENFLESSYGFRPGIGPHKALKDLRKQIVIGKTMWIYEVDIKGYFNHINHAWLRRMLSERIKDPVIINLIGKWLKAGVMEDGVLQINNEGAPQGGPISCILSNIYLHYVLDLWYEKVVKTKLEGETKLIRFVDDFVICFQFRSDALKVQEVLKKRLKKFNLDIAEDKTKLICFGRFAQERMFKQSQKVKSFVFLGFKHICGTSKDGAFALIRVPSTKACSKFLKKTKEWLWKHMHLGVKQHQQKLKEMLTGLYGYFGLTHCCHKLNLVQYIVRRQWRRVLMRRSQTGPCRYWKFLAEQEWFELPNPKAYHSDV